MLVTTELPYSNKGTLVAVVTIEASIVTTTTNVDMRANVTTV